MIHKLNKVLNIPISTSADLWAAQKHGDKNMKNYNIWHMKSEMTSVYFTLHNSAVPATTQSPA